MTEDIGRVSTEDFLHLKRERPRRWGLSLVATCVVCLGAGFGGGFVGGKNSASMTLETALSRLADAPKEEWSQHIALGAAFRGVRNGVDAIEFWCDDRGAPGLDASLYLRHIARACVLAIDRLAENPLTPHHEVHLKSLDELRGHLQ